MLVFLLIVPGRRASADPIFPGADWERETNGLAVGDVRGVDALLQTLDTTALMVVKNGRVVYEYGDVTRLSYLASARKSILSMLYGPYVASGKIRFEATLNDLGMSDLGGLLAIEQRAKVVDLITARSGVYHPAANSGDLLFMAPKRGSKEPGAWWLYSNWDFNAAGAAFEQMAGTNIYDALRANLAVPIGMQDFDRKRQQKVGNLARSQYPAYHMVLSTRDMARLGLLMLRQGQWQDRQLIPAEWVRRSTSVQTPPAEMRPWEIRNGPWGYGYMWWVWNGPSATGPYQGAYTAAGAYGQFITVLPALDMVVAHKTWPSGHVNQSDYLRLLDLLTGKRPASPTEFALWKYAPRICRASRNLAQGARFFLDACGIYKITASILLTTSLLILLFVIRKAGLRRSLRFGLPALVILGLIICVTGWMVTPAKAPAPPRQRIAINLDPGLYDALSGLYLVKFRHRNTLTIKRNGDALVCQLAGAFPEELFPESQTEFFNAREDTTLTFIRNDKGEVTGLTAHVNGKSYPGTKLAEQKENPVR